MFEEQEQFPKFLKSIWGTGTVPQIPQNVDYLGKMVTVFPKKNRGTCQPAKPLLTDVYGMKLDKQFVTSLEDNIR